MKKFFTIFFVTLGVMFFCLIIVGVWFYAADPLELKPLYRMLTADSVVESSPVESSRSGSVEDEVSGSVVEDRNPALNVEQEAALETIGVDPASLPSTITPEQESCFVEVLGQARVDEIKAGDTPSATEFFKARGCL